MTDFIELVLKTIITFLISSVIGESPYVAKALQGIIYISVGYFLVVRTQLQTAKRIQQNFYIVSVIFWLLMFSFLVTCLLLGFEIWPSLILLIVYYHSLESKNLRIMRWIPSLQRLFKSIGFIRQLRIDFHKEFEIYYKGKPRKSDLRKYFRSASFIRNLREVTVFLITIATGVPALWLCLISAFVMQPIASIIQHHSLQDLPMNSICALGTGMCVHFILIGHSFWIINITFDTTYSEIASQTTQETVRIKKKADKYLNKFIKESIGGYPKFILKTVLLITLTGIGTSLHFTSTDVIPSIILFAGLFCASLCFIYFLFWWF